MDRSTLKFWLAVSTFIAIVLATRVLGIDTTGDSSYWDF